MNQSDSLVTDRSFRPIAPRKSVFEEILDDWIGHLDDQLRAPTALGPGPKERLRIEAARSAYVGLRRRAVR